MLSKFFSFLIEIIEVLKLMDFNIVKIKLVINNKQKNRGGEATALFHIYFFRCCQFG